MGYRSGVRGRPCEAGAAATRMRKHLANIIALAVGCLLAALALEIGLRLLNPFGFRLRGDRIVLPHSMTRVIENTVNPALDPVIRHTKNSLGFRGPEPPRDLNNRFSILTVGGSTTECFYIPDGKTWPDILAERLQGGLPSLWLNNAGLDGMSTVGHLRLMEQVVTSLRPRMVIFLVGLNDTRVNDIRRQYDASPMVRQAAGWAERLASRSEIANTLLNLRRYSDAKRQGLATVPTGFMHGTPLEDARRTPPLDAAAFAAYRPAFVAHEEEDIAAYRQRLERLIRICRDMGSRPVFLTQPSLYACQGDPQCGGNAASVMLDGFPQLLWAERLERYNQATRETCARENVPVIDMAALFPASTANYYDFVHYTNAGCALFGEIVAERLLPLLADGRPDAGTR